MYIHTAIREFPTQIAVMLQLLEMKIFAHLKIHVEQIKEIATFMMIAKWDSSVDQTIVQKQLTLMPTRIAVLMQLLEKNFFAQL